MTRSLVVVKVTYNGLRCETLYYIPGELVDDIRTDVVKTHFPTGFKIISEDNVHLGRTDRLQHEVRYEMVCKYALDKSNKTHWPPPVRPVWPWQEGLTPILTPHEGDSSDDEDEDSDSDESTEDER